MTRHFRVTTIVLLALVATLLAIPGRAAAKTFDFPGRGWGHGMGMSQWGARGLADERGWSASKILTHYYRGAKVGTGTSPKEIRVGVLWERTLVTVTGDGSFDFFDRTGVKRVTAKANETWRISRNAQGSLDVFGPGDSKPHFTAGVPVTVRYEVRGTLLKLPQTGYRYKHGRIDFDINKDTKKVRAILIVAFEQYLYGLGEMPSSWNTEALKAQAIAGRSYALEKVTRLGQNRPTCNCGVYATTVDQAYVGYVQEVPRWVAAVDTTRGQVATSGGKVIQALYSSSSGGYTENNELVTGGTPVSYLRGTCDPGDYDGGDNPHSNWIVSLSDSELGERMASAGYDVGVVSGVDVVPPRGVSGRITALSGNGAGGVRVKGTKATKLVSAGTFRSALGLKSTLVFHRIYGAIRVRYDTLSCRPGLPRSGEYSWKDLDGTTRGRAQNFLVGRLFWNPDTKKVYWTLGAILERYDALRKSGQDYGMPTTDELSVTGGRASYFERGRIYWSSKTHAHGVRGAILAEYLDAGGPAKWGLPTTDELGAPGGRSSRFQKGRIYWASAYGAHLVYGAVLDKYIALGGAAGRLGLPTTDEVSIKTGRVQRFEHGSIVWDSRTGKASVAP